MALLVRTGNGADISTPKNADDPSDIVRHRHDDIDGTTRTDAWDIGADEAVTGTEPLTPKIIAWREIEPVSP